MFRAFSENKALKVVYSAELDPDSIYETATVITFQFSSQPFFLFHMTLATKDYLWQLKN